MSRSVPDRFYRSALCYLLIGFFASVCGNTPASSQMPLQPETAKPADAVSPYGVSYLNGSFNYKLPVLEIGNGEWPNKISVVLSYDSSQDRGDNNSWSIDEDLSIRKTDVYDDYDANGIRQPFNDVDQISVVSGGSMIPFFKLDDDYTVNSFEPASLNGHTLSFEPTAQPYYHNEGFFVFTSRNGDVIRDTTICCGYAPVYTSASGIRVNWYPNNYKKIRSTNTGVAILIDERVPIGSDQYSQKICSFNLTLVDLSTVNSCAGSAQSATVIYKRFEGLIGREQVISVKLPNESVYNFEYVRVFALSGQVQYGDTLASIRLRYQLRCIKQPGAENCLIANEYDACDGPGGEADFDYTGSRDRVKKQTLADGRIITYSYLPVMNPCRLISSVNMSVNGSSRSILGGGGNYPWWITPNIVQVKDEMNRTTTYGWKGINPIGYPAAWSARNDLLGSIQTPEGNGVEYTYDGRGNIVSAHQIAKPGSNLSDIVSSAVYPSSCSNRKTCNKPTSVTDPKGNVTSFTYDAAHGGVLTVTSPGVGGVQPVRRYSYAQYYAWLKVAGGGYAQASTPVWLMTGERTCRTTATVGNACAGGTADEVATSYEYQTGNATTPSNLWLKGVAVTADGQTLRTCYGYDVLGRRISETKPAAGLAVCPQ
jgi:YD repeat-containing protein